MDGGMVFMPGVPGFPPGASWATRATLPQKAPGGSRGTPGRMAIPRAMHVDVAQQWREAFAAWTVGVCGMDGGMVFVPGVSGFPPGASWAGPDS